MPPCLSRLVRALTRSRPSHRSTPRLADLQLARQQMLESLQDCDDGPTLRLRARIRTAATHKDLWMLRSEVFHVISLHHCQSVAVERIDQLMHVFDEWVAWSDSTRPS